MRIIFFGTPDYAADALEAVVAAGHDVSLVVTMPDKPKGRKGEPVPPPVKEAALRHQIPVYQPVKIKDPDCLEILSREKPDLIIVTAYGRIIPKAILDLPKYGCINEHASLLPAYRGAAPIQWSVLDGCKKTGVSIMQMDEGLDTGDVLSMAEVEIDKDETSGSLFDKLSKTGADLLVRTIESIEKGTCVRTPQPKDSTTAYARMIKKADGEICWDRPAEELECLVRGMSPWPSAYTKLNGKMLKIWKASVCADESGAMPGEIIKTDKTGIFVKTGDQALVLQEVQLEGKKRMDHATFLRGNSAGAGTVLGK